MRTLLYYINAVSFAVAVFMFSGASGAEMAKKLLLGRWNWCSKLILRCSEKRELQPLLLYVEISSNYKAISIK